MRNGALGLTDEDRAMLGAIMIDAVRPVGMELLGGRYSQYAMLGDRDVCEFTRKFIKYHLLSSNADDGHYHLTQAGFDEI